MIIDLNTLPKTSDTICDVCIIGGGVAGITLAKEFKDLQINVILLESGGLEFESKTQALYKGKNSGKNYFTLDTSRMRLFGGTSNHWGGNCRTLESIDFKPRGWVKNSGWPISEQEVRKYYSRAQDVCNLDKSKGFSIDKWETTQLKKIKTPTNMQMQMTQFAASDNSNGASFNALNFGSFYKSLFDKSKNINLYLHANVTKIIENENKAAVSTVIAKSLEGNEIRVRSKYYVLASGGIENARILLANNIGNSNDLVGRYFMEHLSAKIGIFQPTTKTLSDFDICEIPERRIKIEPSSLARTKGYFTFDSETQEQLKILNSNVSIWRSHLHPSFDSQGYKSLRAVFGDLKAGYLPRDFDEHVANITLGLDDIATSLNWKYRKKGAVVDQYIVGAQIEQSPNANSRITLSEQSDELGVPKVNLNWQLNEIDIHTIKQVANLTARFFGAEKLGRMKMLLPSDDNDIRKYLRGDWHHIGTTRMGHSNKTGVVNTDCRLHCKDNFYIAGSSVFPTGGHAVPTFTIVALTLRLADHLKSKLSKKI